MASKAALQTKVDDLTLLLEQVLECFSVDNTTFNATVNDEPVCIAEECERLLEKIDYTLYNAEWPDEETYYDEDD